MTIREVIIYPDERLRKKALLVQDVNADIVQLVDDMAETMYAAPGIGLAANQVGVLKRVVVIDVEYSDNSPNLVVLINPQIAARSGEILWEEGCLSLPGVLEDVKRFEHVTVQALGRAGEPVEIEAEGLLAVALQHELDHLDGIVFIDHVSLLKRRLAHRELVKRKRTE